MLPMANKMAVSAGYSYKKNIFLALLYKKLFNSEMYKKSLCRLFGFFALTSLSIHANASEAPAGATRTAAWNSEKSEYTPDKTIIYGKLDNGLTYAIKPNDRPQNQILVRMAIDFGSAAEADDELGLAHFIEHMAFNGTTNVPEGEMVKILERLGLSFGADTNASTGYTQTQYTLNIPNLNPETLDQSLFLMRETASEIAFNPKAVDRERGIILEEKRVRENFQARSGRASIELYYPDTFYVSRSPIGTEEILKNAPAERMKSLYKRYYTPDRTKLVIVGPVDPVKIEKMIIEKFASWKGESRSLGEFDNCQVDTNRLSEAAIFSHPKITETLSANQFLKDRKRSEGIERSIISSKMTIANAIIANRINKQLRGEDTPILRANLNFSFNLCDQYASIGYGISGKDGSRDAMIPFIQKHINSALTYGFQKNEVDEIIKALDNQRRNAIKSEATRQSSGYAGALSSQTEDVINDSQQSLQTWLQVKPFLTPDAIHIEFNHWFSQLNAPLFFYTTKNINAQYFEASGDAATVITEVSFDEKASDNEETLLSEADKIKIEEIKANFISSFKKSLSEPAEPIEEKKEVIFAYTDFGKTGKIARDGKIDDLDIRTVSFENGVKLNIKSTDFEDNRVRYSFRIAGGTFHLGPDNNTLSQFINRTITTAALGKHDIDELRSVILGTTASPGIGVSTTYFGTYGAVAPKDLLLQMQLLAAYTTDPGYREEAIRLFKRPLDEIYKSLDSSPGRALSLESSKILNDNDPRFIFPEREEWDKLDFEKVRNALSDALQSNALEIGIVGDISEEEAIAVVAKTFGALPARKTDIPTYDEQRIANYSTQFGTYTIKHKGEPDQLAWQRIWTTDDDSDFKLELTMELLADIINLNLTEELREKLGATYGSSVRSSMSSIYKGRGSFTIGTSGDVDKLNLIEQTVDEVVADVIANMPEQDIFERARKPQFESYKDWRLRNSTWVSIVDTAQTEKIWLDRFLINEKLYHSITREDIWNAAKKYLTRDSFTFRSIPEGFTLPSEKE